LVYDYLEFVIEVGPGPGGITRKLFEHGAARVAAIEKDIRLLPALQVNNIRFDRFDKYTIERLDIS
jgi:16S rRNA A1518/A1519 N6-dimethyltransferase RsmA/KsgA/DIM1 with predicted DNA glycosylase/AP lyase activity